MKKIVVYGTGDYYRNYKHNCPKDVEIVAYGNSNVQNSTSHSGNLYEGKPVLAPEEIKGM